MAVRRRRAGVCLMLVLTLLAALGVGSAAAQPAGPIKIGLIRPYSGPWGVVGDAMAKGVQLHLKELGGKVAGREVVLLVEDDENKGDVGLAKVRKLAEQDGVSFLIGPVGSHVALAIRDYVHQAKLPTVVPVAITSDLTTPDKASPYIFRVQATVDQIESPFGHWLYEKRNVRKVFILASDIAAGRGAAAMFKQAFLKAGGAIEGEVFPPLQTPDFAPFMSQLSRGAPDAVYAWLAGGDSSRFLQQWHEFGFKQKLPLYGGMALAEELILPVVKDKAGGVIQASPYVSTLDTPNNQRFVKAYQEEFKTRPTFYATNAYTAAQLVTEALKQVQGQTAAKEPVLAALRKAISEIRSPLGAIEFDERQQIVKDIYITEIQAVGGQLLPRIIDTIPKVRQAVK